MGQTYSTSESEDNKNEEKTPRSIEKEVAGNSSKICIESPLSQDACAIQYNLNNELIYLDWITLYFYADSDSGSHIVGMINYILLLSGKNNIGKCICYPAFTNVKTNKRYNAKDVFDLDTSAICDNQCYFKIKDNLISSINSDIISSLAPAPKNKKNDKKKPYLFHLPNDLKKKAGNNLAEEKFTVCGHSKDNSLLWNLKVNPASANSAPFYVLKDFSLPLNRKINFISYIPAAKVAGEVRLEGEAHDVECVGEIERINGNFAGLSNFSWSLSHGYSEIDDISFYYFINDDLSGFIRIKQQDKIMKWTSKEFTIKEMFADKNKNGSPDVKYPNTTIISGNNSTFGTINIIYSTTSISASEDKGTGSAENEIKIKIVLNENKTYEMYGIAEFHRISVTSLIEKNLNMMTE